MEISLVRHGKSEFVQKGAVTLQEFKRWVENYNFHGVSDKPVCPPETIRKTKAAHLVLTSDLKRSIESAKRLNLPVEFMADPLFRETELPSGSIKFFGIKLKPGVWAMILRLLWFTGYSSKCESLKEAKSRAKKAAGRLIAYAGEYESVALIGHGFFNMLIAKELKKNGWKGEKKIGTRHWNCTSYFPLPK